MSERKPFVWPEGGIAQVHDKPIPPGYETAILVDPFEIFCGPFFDKMRQGETAFAFRVDERHVNVQKVCHGGMLLTFADSSLGFTVWSVTDRAPCVTLSMQGNFLKPARIGDLVEVRPEVTRRTRELVFVRGDYKVGGDIVMTATSIWKLLTP